MKSITLRLITDKQEQQYNNNMSYCIECYSRNGHANGCPEDDGEDYIPEDVEPEEDDYVPDYDVEWNGKELQITNW